MSLNDIYLLSLGVTLLACSGLLIWMIRQD